MRHPARKNLGVSGGSAGLLLRNRGERARLKVGFVRQLTIFDLRRKGQQSGKRRPQARGAGPGWGFLTFSERRKSRAPVLVNHGAHSDRRDIETSKPHSSGKNAISFGVWLP